jgi:hypothetical protein
MKYVIGKNSICIFSENISHDRMSRQMDGEIVSAGFCRFNNGGLESWGRSVSLNSISKPEDDAILNGFLNKIED